MTNANEMNSIKYQKIDGQVDGIEFYFPAGDYMIGADYATLRLTVTCSASDSLEFSGYDGNVVHVTYKT